MITLDIPRSSSWVTLRDIQRRVRSVGCKIDQEHVIVKDDGHNVEAIRLTLKFEPVESPHGVIVGRVLNGTATLFNTDETKAISKSCLVCDKGEHKKMLVIKNSDDEYFWIHTKCAEVSNHTVYTYDYSQRVPEFTSKDRAWPLDAILRTALLVTGPEGKGLVTKAKSNATGAEPTSDVVVNLLSGTTKTIIEPYPELDKDFEDLKFELAKAAAVNSNDWITNLKSLPEYTSQVGLAVSALVLLQQKRRIDTAPKGFVSPVEIEGLQLEVLKQETTSEFYGYAETRVTTTDFQTDDGRLVMWATSGRLGVVEDAEVGDKFTLEKATVSKTFNMRYRGDVTKIVRAKFRV